MNFSIERVVHYLKKKSKGTIKKDKRQQIYLSKNHSFNSILLLDLFGIIKLIELAAADEIKTIFVLSLLFPPDFHAAYHSKIFIKIERFHNMEHTHSHIWFLFFVKKTTFSKSEFCNKQNLMKIYSKIYDVKSIMITIKTLTRRTENENESNK